MLIVYADGACRGNPGPMGIGVSIQMKDGKEIETVSEAIGEGTNNRAEYQAAIEGLKRASKQGADEIELRMDSELVVKQLQGEYQVRKAELKPLYAELSGLLASFKKPTVVHVKRDQNPRADELANLALDNAESLLNDSEGQLAETIVALLRKNEINPQRARLVLAEVTHLLRTDTPLKR